MKRLTIIIIGLLLSLQLFSHPWKPAYYVIIDTDGGIDDMRAINLLLASPNVRVLAITASSGALSAQNTYLKVRSLLNSSFNEGLPVGLNRKDTFKSPDFPTALQAKWGVERNIISNNAPEAVDLIREIFLVEKTKISFVCLGGLNTVNRAINEIPEFMLQVKDILWSADGIKDTNGFNYNIDKKASVNILSGKIPVKVILKSEASELYNDELIKRICTLNTFNAKSFSSFFNSEIIRNHKFAYTGNDDMVPLFLHYPELFKTTKEGSNTEAVPEDILSLREKILIMLKGETVATNQVIKAMPSDSAFYFPDIQKDVSEIIDKFGMDEWTSGVFANELHRHLGVFAIIGVKMGIRAREYFATGVDEFKVTSFAGSVPPLSCMNDGVQVSTGATPGHGLLTVSSDSLTRPVAEFTYLNRKIRITLKPEISTKIISELKEINFVYGLDSNIYWELVRKNSIKYWRSLDRHDIFQIDVIK
jgi:inosine-uridine nucleoside N-ribohydrolase/formylmethanofuran dehydrogenase subunit E